MFKSGFLGERKQHTTAGVNVLKIVSYIMLIIG